MDPSGPARNIEYMTKPCKKRVVMAREVANRWLTEASAPEYRMTVYESGSSKPVKMLSGLLRSFRDGKLVLGGVGLIADLGVSDGQAAGSITIWSSNHAALITLDLSLIHISEPTRPY